MTDVRDRAAAIAREVADLLALPDDIAAHGRRAGRATWSPGSLHAGHPGIAVLHATLGRHDPARADGARAHLAMAGRSAPSVSTLPALLPAVLVHRTTYGGYERLVRQAEAATLAAARAALREHAARPEPGLAMSDYDAVAGLSATGRLLLELADDPAADTSVQSVLADVLGYLTSITEPVVVHGVEVPGWWCSPQRYPLDVDRERYPFGDFNVGLAHGVAGPLALLALAHLRGYRVDGMRGAIERAARWLAGCRTIGEHGPSWPGRIDFRVQTGSEPPARTTGRAAWCYGTAGVVRALQLAGTALDDGAVTALAMDGLRGVLAGGPERAGLTDLSLCHGEAGLLQIALRMAASAGDPGLDPAIDGLAERLVGRFDHAVPFGFRHGPAAADEPGLLYGAAGIALALADLAHPPPADGYCWDAALLLS